jgi:hypothetical protein
MHRMPKIAMGNVPPILACPWGDRGAFEGTVRTLLALLPSPGNERSYYALDGE